MWRAGVRGWSLRQVAGLLWWGKLSQRGGPPSEHSLPPERLQRGPLGEHRRALGAGAGERGLEDLLRGSEARGTHRGHLGPRVSQVVS